jgi:hypothetical protein
MARDILERAALNNAMWCDAVCSAHGAAGEFLDSIWLHRAGVPRYYPDAVTLAGAGAIAQQERTISALIRSRQGGWSVKDSFHGLDLSRLGFSALFEAQWICASPAPANAPQALKGLKWEKASSETELQLWERAWAKSGSIPGQPRTFLPPLLSDPDVVFLLGLRDNLPIGGGVLNRGAEVVGLSNVFSVETAPETIWRDLISEAGAIFTGLPLVGYEHSAELATALQAGFEPIGPLRIWVRP